MSFYVLDEDIHPLLTSDILIKLSECKVNSVIDLLSCDLSKIRSISRKKEIDFQKLLEIKDQLYRRFGPNKWNAFDLIGDPIDRIGFMTGIEKFDEMLVNGIKKGEVTELYGYPDSGKTQFCYTLAVNVVHKYNERVLFIDTDLCFSETRVKNIAEYFLNDTTSKIMSNIKMLTINDISSLLSAIETISNDLRTNPNSEYKDFGLVIIDCLSTPLTLEFKKNIFDAQNEEKDNKNLSKASDLKFRFVSLVTQMANTLNALASEHSIAVIVVNTQSFELKKNWKNYCKLCLNFYKYENTDENNGENRGSLKSKAIKICKTYDKTIENKSYNKFKITEIGFI